MKYFPRKNTCFNNSKYGLILTLQNSCFVASDRETLALKKFNMAILTTNPYRKKIDQK